MWLKEGDKKTIIMIFFHDMVNAHSRRNFSAKIKIHGTWLLEEKDIKEGVVQAFQALLTNSGDWRPCLNGLLFEGLEA